METKIPVPFYAGEIEFYSVNESLRTVSYKIPGQIGCTRNFCINGLESKEETMIRIRETIAGFDRYSLGAYLPYL